MEFIQTPAGIGAAVVGLVVLIILLRVVRGKGGNPMKRIPSQMEKLAAAGDYAGAAAEAHRQGEDDAAIEYYLRAQEPDQAAQLAVRNGEVRRAAQIYERAKRYDRAATMYDKAGMGDKAEELRALLPKSHPTQQARAAQVSVDGAADIHALETELRDAIARSTGSEADQAEVQRLARTAADEFLSCGEIQRAADIYRDAGMDDEAIHLYVNVLGAPGEAAPILASRGNHQRAAELYELAGAKERAAAAWVRVAEDAPHPDSYVDRIEALSAKVARRFLKEQTAMRVLTKDSVELFYRYAQVLERVGEAGLALDLFGTIRDTIGPYRDVYDHITKLQSGVTGSDTEPAVHIEPASAQAPAGPAAKTTADAGAGTAIRPGGYQLSEGELRSLAMQVAQAAAAELGMGNDLAKLMAVPKFKARGQRTREAARAVGLEQIPISLDMVFDSEVNAARMGPSIDTLNRFIKGDSCTLQNIEVFHRIGLAHLAAGDWDKALAAFDAVDEASPGYRDDYKRADQIRGWKDAMGGLTGLRPASEEGADVSGGGRYDLLGELGRGGMAVVYRGVDSLLGREVALKFLSENLSAQEDMRTMFEREARSVAQLNHPNIVTIHDFGVLEGRAFICMEFIEGRSIEQLLSLDQGLTIVESLRITKQALDALAYAHGRGIIHRDIKPANMMRTTSGLVKIMDFGLAKSMSSTSKKSFIAGTPAYMPPEQLAGHVVDHRADLFALGVTVYEMLTGQLPFEGMDRSSEPLSLRHHVPAIPEILDDAVLQALAFDPDERIPNAMVFAHPIEQILSSVSRFAGADTPVKSPPPSGSAATEMMPSGAQRKPPGKAPPTVLLENND